MEVAELEQVQNFIRDLERALNSHDAIEYNRYFKKDISWGNPNGGRPDELAPLHETHLGFLQGPLRNSRFKYTIERVQLLTGESAYVHCRLTRTNEDGSTVESDERCLYVLVREHNHWWLQAGHNTRIQSA